MALWSGFAGLAIDAIGQDIDHFRHVWVLIGLAAASAFTSAAFVEPQKEDPEGPGWTPLSRGWMS